MPIAAGAGARAPLRARNARRNQGLIVSGEMQRSGAGVDPGAPSAASSRDAESARVVDYMRARGVVRADVSVLVQELVEADVSAVVFSVNPVTRNPDEVVINASIGLGEAIVGGLVTPDEIVVSKSSLAVVSYEIATKEPPPLSPTLRCLRSSRNSLRSCTESSCLCASIAANSPAARGRSDEPPGLLASSLTYSLTCRGPSRLMATTGVRPMVCEMLSKIMVRSSFCWSILGGRRGTDRG